MSPLFSPLTLRGTIFANLGWVSAMCQYSAPPREPARGLQELGSQKRLSAADYAKSRSGESAIAVGRERWLRWEAGAGRGGTAALVAG
jgi:hypothetical protein